MERFDKVLPWAAITSFPLSVAESCSLVAGVFHTHTANTQGCKINTSKTRARPVHLNIARVHDVYMLLQNAVACYIYLRVTLRFFHALQMYAHVMQNHQYSKDSSWGFALSLQSSIQLQPQLLQFHDTRAEWNRIWIVIVFSEVFVLKERVSWLPLWLNSKATAKWEKLCSVDAL